LYGADDEVHGAKLGRNGNRGKRREERGERKEEKGEGREERKPHPGNGTGDYHYYETKTSF
jgi:hypothetical protein